MVAIDGGIVVAGIVLGFLVGIFAALSGTGGGALNVPILEIILLFDIHLAIGTSLFVVLVNSVSTNVAYFKQRRVDVKTGGFLLLFSAPASILGSLLTGIVSTGFATGKMVMIAIFYGFIMLVGVLMLRQDRGAGKAARGAPFACAGSRVWTRRFVDAGGEPFEYTFTYTRIIPVAILAGFLAGFLGIGGGLVQVPMLHLMCGIPIHVTVATSGFMILGNALTGSLAKLAVAEIDLVIGLIFALGTIAGAQVGARVAKGTTNKRLKQVIAIVLVVLAAYKIASLLW